MTPYLFILAATFIGAGGAFFLKRGAASFAFTVQGTVLNWPFVLGGVLYVAAIPVYLAGLRTLPLSLAYPLTSLTYVWSALLARNLLGEKVSAMRWAGIGAIIAGTALAVLP